MQPLAYLQFAFALVVAIGWIALAIEQLHIIERVEEQELWKEVKEKSVKTG